MTTYKPPLKDLPKAPSKSKIYKMYYYESRSYIKNQINTILGADGDSIFRRSMNGKQFLELVATIGTPLGYKEPQNENE